MTDSSRQVLYVNVYIKDASKVIQSTVEEKISQKKLPAPIKARLAKRAAKVAGDLVGTSVIVKQLVPKLCEDIPKKMKSRGLSVHVEEVFRQGPVFVLELQVVHVDSVVMTAARKRIRDDKDKDNFAVQCLKQFLNVIGSKNQDTLERKHLPKIVQSKIPLSLGDMLCAELAENGMEAEAEVLPEALQARFFFPFLRQIQEQESESKAKAKKGPLASLRRN
uniref:Uncharacterized protein n=1 Tax=Cyclophora tenuis TaxID=216820 RepID=A0A7S1D2W4_CYCTE|mmetsp:Transcript_17760/g.30165  ORF Transcript_17760/g.30165 Transcript_17760/m.30165 type:complete len:221 (+) Transcript_17760:131-793(+)